MLDAKVSKLLNEQINKELYSAYLYLDFSIYSLHICLYHVSVFACTLLFVLGIFPSQINLLH